MIKDFFTQYRSFYVAYGILSTSFMFLFFLYQLPLEFLFHSLILSLTLLLILSFGLYWKFRERIQRVNDAGYEDDLSMLDQPVDLAYRKRIETEKQKFRHDLLAMKSREEDLQSIVKMWSHQMKVPLAALSLMSQTDQLNQQDVNYQLQRLDHYMANLLNYLKLTNKVSDFRFEPVEVRSIVLDLVKKYRQQFLQQNISVVIEGDWCIKSDRKWLSFAVGQIIDNAIKYNKPGGSVSILLDHGMIIKDSGIGILEEDIPRLFDEGFTGYNGREHQKATGFGLYLTKRILAPLALGIRVESQVDLGTQVIITSIKKH